MYNDFYTLNKMKNIKIEDLDGNDLSLNDEDQKIIDEIFGEPEWEEHTTNDFLLYFALAIVIAIMFAIFKSDTLNGWLSNFASSHESLLLLEMVIIYLLVILFDRIFLGIRGRIQGWHIS